jgi:glycosyltransferase involved in cell wall biosynthesis
VTNRGDDGALTLTLAVQRKHDAPFHHEIKWAPIMNFFGYYVLNLKPTILSFVGGPLPVPEWLRPNAFIEHVPWWHTTRRMLRRKYQQLMHERTKVHHSLMVHAPDEDYKRKLLKVKGAFISQNIYVDVDTFKPSNREKIYDCIYVAQLKPYKRHYLAKNLERILLVTHDVGARKSYQRIVPNASFNDHSLSKVEMADALNSARCSLALSKVEGGMLASFESLLCGVPVVSTRSKGGRDVFLNSCNSIIVDANEKDVASAVAHFKRNPPDPELIRARALSDIESHRIQFCNYISDLSVFLGGIMVDPMERYEKYFGAKGGLTEYFIGMDKIDSPLDMERINGTTFIG